MYFDKRRASRDVGGYISGFQRKTGKYLEVQEIRCNFASAYSGLLAIDGS